MRTIFLEEMTWADVKAAMENGVDSVLIPLGAIEQHGYHLPIFTDSWLGYALCGPIAHRVGNMLVAPPIYPGRSDHHMSFSGTLSITSQTFQDLVADYCRSLARHGFKNLALFATHGGNFKDLGDVLPKIQAELPGVNIVIITSSQAGAVGRQVNIQLGLDLDKCGQHAGLTEASMLLATRPELVHMDKAVEGWVGGYGPDFTKILEEKGMRAFSEYGILGDPREATATTGIDILNGRANGYAQLLREQLARTEDIIEAPFVPVGRHKLPSDLLLEEMTSLEIKEAIDSGWDTVCVMLGAIEQHGPHLPLGTDTMLGYERGVRIAEQLGHTLVAPVMRPGLSDHHMGFPGTITLRYETFTNMVFEVCVSLSKHGFKKVILVPTHGGNYSAAADIHHRIETELPEIKSVYLGREDSRYSHAQIQPELQIDPRRAGVHAGLMETSFMLVHRPELVQMDKVQEGWVGDFDGLASAQLANGGTHTLSPIGVLGDPRGSNAELGEKYLTEWTTIYTDIIKQRI